MIGTSLSHYRITEKLGQGGMGEVYRAEDKNLSRQVAIKVLPDEFAHDAERLARFQREAQVLASLNHPNIATLYGLEESDGKRFIVMELLEGQTLAHRLLKGPLPVDEALEVCRQIAEGLEAAHEKGVIHRDLKPGNVMITPNDRVKILDFGLAKALAGESRPPDATHSPTITEAMTRPGVILGTAAYMSPEQARGKLVDKRADIWAFGCVLYECLSGKRAFRGDTITDTVAAILKSEPDWTILPAETPPHMRSLLRRCLRKDPALRLHDVADARVDLQGAAAPDSEFEQGAALARTRWRLLPWSVALVMLLVAAALVLRIWRMPEKAQVPTRRFVISLPQPLNQDFSPPNLAVSSDGMQLAYSGGSSDPVIYHRRLDELEFKPIVGTAGGHNPFFSPDGKWIGFLADGRLRKVPVAPGSMVTLSDNFGIWIGGGIWEANDSILFEPNWSRGIARTRASVSGSAPEILFTPDQKNDERILVLPQTLPGDDLVLFTVASGNIVSSDESQIKVGRLGNRSLRTTLTGGTHGLYLPTGHLVYAYDGKLMAAPLDLAKLKLDGSAVPVLAGIYMRPSYSGASFAVSNSGDLVYAPGGMRRSRDGLVLVDWIGDQQPINIPRAGNESHDFSSPAVSPDGSRIAIHLSKTNDDIHIYESSSGTLTRFTFEDGDERTPVWTPDGMRLAYTSEPGPVFQMFLKKVDGSSPPEPIFGSEHPRYPCSFSPDGKTLAFVENNPKTGWDIWTGSINGEEKPKPFLQTRHFEAYPAFSPDGRWMAYQSDKSGRVQVYVTSYPDGRDEKQISVDGGVEPRWGPSGKELFFISEDRLMLVETSLKPTIRATKTRVLFAIDRSTIYSAFFSPLTGYAVMPDGKRFVFIKKPQMDPVTQLILVENWFEELKRLCPTGKMR